MQQSFKKDSTLANAVSVWDTGIPVNLLKFVGKKSVAIPEDFVSLKMLQNYIIKYKNIKYLFT